MATDIYERLASHLDNLPGGFPSTESGVELRILKRLFTPDEAGLALHLTLIPEEPRVIARRARIAVQEAEQRLAALAEKGLTFSIHREGKAPQYQASQYAVGIWEFQVNRLHPELVQDMDEYWPTFFDLDDWKQQPQLRTIPVNESIEAELSVMPYERAEELVQAHDKIAVAPCICRREHEILGEGCDKPQETCLSFGDSAEFYLRNRLGRPISQEEALDTLTLADEAALVLQPSNSQHAEFICCCCGRCCGVLRNIKRHPQPSSLVSAPFAATLTTDTCKGCGVCVDRCQMEALSVVDRQASLDVDRCIGCGLCVSTCPTDSLALVRKPESEQTKVPRGFEQTLLRLGQKRGKLGAPDLARMVARSKADRLMAAR
jgi:electron transport complex protein RnfB